MDSIGIISDIKLPLFAYKIPETLINNLPKNCHTLIIAGNLGHVINPDLQLNRLFIDTLRFLRSKYRWVIYVPGNMEFQSFSPKRKIEDRLRYVCRNLDVVFLQKNIFVHPCNGIVFIGCTLWSTQDSMYEEHRDWLLNQSFIHQYAIIVTHFPPSILLREKLYTYNLIGWITGHCEDASVIIKDEIPLVSNPLSAATTSKQLLYGYNFLFYWQL